MAVKNSKKKTVPLDMVNKDGSLDVGQIIARDWFDAAIKKDLPKKKNTEKEK